MIPYSADFESEVVNSNKDDKEEQAKYAASLGAPSMIDRIINIVVEFNGFTAPLCIYCIHAAALVTARLINNKNLPKKDFLFINQLKERKYYFFNFRDKFFFILVLFLRYGFEA